MTHKVRVCDVVFRFTEFQQIILEQLIWFAQKVTLSTRVVVVFRFTEFQRIILEQLIWSWPGKVFRARHYSSRLRIIVYTRFAVQYFVYYKYTYEFCTWKNVPNNTTEYVNQKYFFVQFFEDFSIPFKVKFTFLHAAIDRYKYVDSRRLGLNRYVVLEIYPIDSKTKTNYKQRGIKR